MFLIYLHSKFSSNAQTKIAGLSSSRRSDDKGDILKQLSSLVAQTTGKPESYVGEYCSIHLCARPFHSAYRSSNHQRYASPTTHLCASVEATHRLRLDVFIPSEPSTWKITGRYRVGLAMIWKSMVRLKIGAVAYDSPFCYKTGILLLTSHSTFDDGTIFQLSNSPPK